MDASGIADLLGRQRAAFARDSYPSLDVRLPPPRRLQGARESVRALFRERARMAVSEKEGSTMSAAIGPGAAT